jgi:hypothetical protein
MDKKIIAIAGKKGSGKDLLGSYLIAVGYKRFAFGDIIRKRVKRDFGLTDYQVAGADKETPTKYTKKGIVPPEGIHWTPRQIMEAYGMFFRQFDEHYWIKQLGKEIEESEADKIVITDVRLLAEAEFLKGLGARLVRLERSEELRKGVYPNANSQAVTEIELDNYNFFDFVLPPDLNKTPDDLAQFARHLLTWPQ